ncbi:FUSC family protein [Psychromonas sp. MME2]|uniref:FUSC family protein n=1 Tax=Psychromonas sp. MME2 TaxID=3231033 RepID=UPI00339BD3D1
MTRLTISSHTKEAIKVGMAFVIAYGIALGSGWLNPYWSALAVAMVSLSPPGLSLKKGMLRAAGTIPGCLAAIAIVALAPQERWLFLGFCSVFIFFTSYMMVIDEDKPYFWNVMGFTCLAVAITAIPGDVNDFFQHAIARTIETILGVAVYSLIGIFIWPQKNTGAIKQAYLKLIHSQKLIIANCQQIIEGSPSSLSQVEFGNQQITLLTNFSNATQIESSENIRIFSNRHLLKGMVAIFTVQTECLQKWHASLSMLSHLDLNAVIPRLNEHLSQRIQLFNEIEEIVSNKKCHIELSEIPLVADPAILKTLSHYDRAAISLTLKELKEIDKNLKYTINYLQGLMGLLAANTVEIYPTPSLWQKTIKPTWISICKAFFPPLVLIIGFIIWIYIDTPGHYALFELAAILAMSVSLNQQINLAEILKNFVLLIPICICIYIFILPEITLFAELALVFFIIVSYASYFFTGTGKLVSLMSINNIIVISNQQNYDVAAIFNKGLFMVMAVSLAYIVSYLLQYSSPEKHVQKRVQYFLKKHCGYLLIHSFLPKKINHLFFLYRLSRHLNEIKALPQDIGTWTPSY